ncbi:hypothetical protein BKA61DRAFT_691054 [Leptodontidium sp. MPI-SDFR-AT-0119]|nr:hypothetical protein BKA61DRAFT_691054 [Leptodontidium sp. MPI-SDFR-AT-0119]
MRRKVITVPSPFKTTKADRLTLVKSKKDPQTTSMRRVSAKPQTKQNHGQIKVNRKPLSQWDFKLRLGGHVRKYIANITRVHEQARSLNHDIKVSIAAREHTEHAFQHDDENRYFRKVQEAFDVSNSTPDRKAREPFSNRVVCYQGADGNCCDGWEEWDEDRLLSAVDDGDHEQLLKMQGALDLQLFDYKRVILDFLREARKALDLTNDALEALENNSKVPEMGEDELIGELRGFFEKKPCNENLLQAAESVIHRGILIGMNNYLRHRTQFEQLFQCDDTLSILKTKGNIIQYDGLLPILKPHTYDVMNLDFVKENSTQDSEKPTVEDPLSVG